MLTYCEYNAINKCQILLINQFDFTIKFDLLLIENICLFLLFKYYYFLFIDNSFPKSYTMCNLRRTDHALNLFLCIILIFKAQKYFYHSCWQQQLRWWWYLVYSKMMYCCCYEVVVYKILILSLMVFSWWLTFKNLIWCWNQFFERKYGTSMYNQKIIFVWILRNLILK